MPRVLLVKTSSLGDVVHNLPVVSDVCASLPAAEIDWAVEETYAEIPRLHPCVHRVVPVAIRRWRGNWLAARVRREIGEFVATLREAPYDAIIDTQGLFKSALIARVAHGVRYGLDWKSSREPLFPFYHHTFAVPRGVHAVERNRRLAARALGYAPAAQIDYGIAAQPGSYAWLPAEYAVFVHATSADDKLWDEAAWIELGLALSVRGMPPVLPWGNAAERERGERLRSAIPGAVVSPPMSLGDLSCVLAGARCVIGVDTGLTHLAGALGVPTVGIFRVTAPATTGLYGCARGVNVGDVSMAPRAAEVLRALQRVL